MTPPYPTEFERLLRRAYASQRRSAVTRGIPFLFTFEQWSEWWLTDDRWSRRGRKAGQLQMGRKGYSGPYSPDNVECATKEQKQKAQANNLQQSWRFDWEPPKAVLKDVWTIDWILGC